MRTIWQLEHRLADAWPALADERLGQWRLRAAGGFTGRANSALTVGDPGVPMSDALGVVHAFADRHGITPTAHVVAGSALEHELAAHGWAVNLVHPGGAESAVLIRALRPGAPDGAEVHERPPDGWWELAVGRAVIDDTLHVARLAVHAEHRRRGVAGALMAAIGAWGARHGATHCALQVAVDNQAALRLYERLGFTEHHRYRYWTPALDAA